jgi:hypothetical protein
MSIHDFHWLDDYLEETWLERQEREHRERVKRGELEAARKPKHQKSSTTLERNKRKVAR